MNATDLFTRLRTPVDQGLVLQLKTQTPLYTGGIGQLGDQIHPSNLLGGVRHMSCLVARTLGDDHFETEVWGNAGQGGQNAAAKQVALRWDIAKLQRVALGEQGVIKIPKAGGGDSKWYFNNAHEGELILSMTRNGISDPHWQMLKLALAIQLRHASFGAKDQFGLGVLATTDSTAVICAPLDTAYSWPAALPIQPGKLNLLRYVFGRVSFRPAPGQRPVLNRLLALKLALASRATLRNALRAKADAPDIEVQRLTLLRHRMLGHLNQFGSAVNVSAAYLQDGNPELRIAVALKPEDKNERAEAFRVFREVIKSQLDGMIEQTGYRTNDAIWEYGGAQANEKKAAWLNKLAGVQA
jgi:hypothetical protein